MDASNTIMKQTFLAVVGAGRYFKPPNSKIYERWVQPCLRGSMGACVPIKMWTFVTGLFPRKGTGGCSCVVIIYLNHFYSSLGPFWDTNYSCSSRGNQILFLKILKISKYFKYFKYFKNFKTKKNFSDLCPEAPARRSFKMIEFLEFEKGTLRSTFRLFLPKKVKRNSISKMKSFWTCRRGGNLL